MEVLRIVVWPAVVVSCFVFFCLCFRSQVSALLGRTTSVGKDGLKAFPPTGQTPIDATRLEQAQEPFEVLISPAIKEREELIRSELRDKGLHENTETTKVLVRHLATANLVLVFEECYRVILGSQILLLKAANVQRATGIAEDDLADYFVEVQEQYAPTFDEWSVDNYIAFLLASTLMVEESASYKITNLGVEFLEWIIKVGATENKGL